MASGDGTHSAPSGGDGGSPSNRGAAAHSATAPAVSTPASKSTVVPCLNELDINGDNGTPSPLPAVSKKKKRGTRAVGPDKNGRGLRQFSMRVCDKVESKRVTTYNEVADELVSEFSDPSIIIDSPDPDSPSTQQFDEKNIRRRVYDALNVLRAMEIISKDKKEIEWRGLPKTSMHDIEELKKVVTGQKHRIEKKTAYLKELEEQYVCLQNLVQRNQQLHGSWHAPSSGLALPFFLVEKPPHGTLEVEMTDDSQIMHFDFNSTQFQLHDETYVMKAMGLCGKQGTDRIQDPGVDGGECSSTPTSYWHQSVQTPGPIGVSVSKSPPTPGILKLRSKDGH